MRYPRKEWTVALFLTAWLTFGCSVSNVLAATHAVGLNRLFEFSIENNNAYANKFNDAELRCKYTAPSKRVIEFSGFYDGDGQGGGDAKKGNIWKLRFMPDELGEWEYSWSWSDGTEGGKGSFTCVAEGAGKGILRPYKENPRWFAYNGTKPVWIKSYYETGHGSISQPFDWISSNVYQPLLDRGYNHLQVNWLLSLCCFGQYYTDGPEPATLDLALYEEGLASSTMRLDVWQLMERRLGWLNDRDVGVHMFLGFEGRKNGGPSWGKLSDQEKEFYVRYVTARLAPFANIAGWNFVWEDPGHRESHELGLARLLEKYDVFNHLRTYQDEHPRDNEYERPEYTFAAVENHYITSPLKSIDRNYRKTAWTHHQACLLGYVPGKPVFMSEGNALWRRYWQKRSGATQNDLRQAAWGCAMAGASFCWNGHANEFGLTVRGSGGMPFHGDDNPYTVSAKYVDVLASVMNDEVAFYRMAPMDHMLMQHDPFRVWCLVEPGKQYLVFAASGEPFRVHVAAGDYADNVWIDAKTGEQQSFRKIKVSENEVDSQAEDDRRIGTKGIDVTPPNSKTDWVLILRSGGAQQ